MSLAKKIAKNTTYLSVSSLIQKVLAFGFYIYLAAQLGEVFLGRYNFALQYTSIFVIIMNFGLVPILTREGAKRIEAINEHFGFILAVKCILTAITIPVMLLLFHGLNTYEQLPNYTIQLVYLATAVIILDTFRSVFLAALRARQEMQYEAFGQIIYQAIVVAGGVLVFINGLKAQAMVVVIMVASAVYFLYSVYVLVTKAGIRPHLRWKRDQFYLLLKMAAPFALADIFFKLNGSIDTVMLEYLAGDRYVAWYNIALKLAVTLTIIPGAFATAFFPAMSRAFTESRDTLRKIFEHTMHYLLVISVPISFATILLASDIIAFAFPDFPATTPALQVFMAGVVFLFINYPIGNLLNAANKQTLNTVNMGIALLVNIIINIVLIPQYTYVGAAIAAVVSSVVLVLLGLPRAYSIVQFEIVPMLNRLALAVIASVSMLAALHLAQPYVHFVGLVGIGVGVYGLTLWLIRGITNAEIKELVRAVMSKNSA